MGLGGGAMSTVGKGGHAVSTALATAEPATGPAVPKTVLAQSATAARPAGLARSAVAESSEQTGATAARAGITQAQAAATAAARTAAEVAADLARQVREV